MAVLEREISCIVIEGLFIKKYDRCIAASMFAMTGFAKSGFDIRNTAVKSRFGFNINGYIFVVVAFQAQIILKSLAYKFVAIVAAVFKFFMSSTQITRHQSLFHFI